MWQKRHITWLLASAFGSILFVLAIVGCDSSGSNPIGAMLTRTSQRIHYWEQTGRRFQFRAVRCLAFAPNGELLAAVRDSGIYISADGSWTWTKISAGLPEQPDIRRIVLSKNNILYAVSDTAVYRRLPSSGTWEPLADGLPAGIVMNGIVNDAARTPFITSSHGLFVLAQDGESWSKVTGGLPEGKAITDVDFLPNGRAAAIDAGGDIYRSLDGQGGWVPVYLPFYVDSAYSLTQNPIGDLCILLKSRRVVVMRLDEQLEMNQLLFAEEIKFFNGVGFLQEVQEKSTDPYSNDIRRYKMMRSVDGGLNWAPLYTGLTTAVIDFVFDASGNGYAVCSDGVMHRTLKPVK